VDDMTTGGGADGTLPSATPCIDALADVQFRIALRGYNMPDVDSFLNDLRVEAESIANSLLEALDRIEELEAELRTARYELDIARRGAPGLTRAAEETGRFSHLSARTSSDRKAERLFDDGLGLDLDLPPRIEQFGDHNHR
jgi:DivIVA domain-containing protein